MSDTNDLDIIGYIATVTPCLKWTELFDPTPSVPAPAGSASRYIPASQRAARPSPSPAGRRPRREIISGGEEGGGQVVGEGDEAAAKLELRGLDRQPPECRPHGSGRNQRRNTRHYQP